MVPELPNKIGRPLLIGEQADRQVQEYIRFLHVTGLAVNTVVVISAAEGILESIDANILQRVKLNKDWAKSLLTQMGMEKRRACSKAKVDIERIETLKKGLLDIKVLLALKRSHQTLLLTGIRQVSTMCQLGLGQRKKRNPKN